MAKAYHMQFSKNTKIISPLILELKRVIYDKTHPPWFANALYFPKVCGMITGWIACSMECGFNDLVTKLRC